MKTQVTRGGSLMVANLTPISNPSAKSPGWHGVAADGAQSTGDSAEECRDNLCNGNLAWLLPVAEEKVA